MIRGVGPLKRPCCVGLADHCCQVPGKLFGHFVKKKKIRNWFLGQNQGQKRVFAYQLKLCSLEKVSLIHKCKKNSINYRYQYLPKSEKNFPLLWWNLIAVLLSNYSAKKSFFPLLLSKLAEFSAIWQLSRQPGTRPDPRQSPLPPWPKPALAGNYCVDSPLLGTSDR